MGQRGPKSEAALTVVAPPEFGHERPGPPAGMTTGAAALWLEIVASLPATWFRPGDLPMLRAYCEASAMNARACCEMEADPVTTTAAGTLKPSPWNAIRNSTAGEMASLATKLRLTVNSRVSNQRAATEGAQPPKSKREGLMFAG